MKDQLKEKEEIIDQREQQIKEFRSKNQHLQNFQKVYDYRVTTLKDERQPLLDHLQNMDVIPATPHGLCSPRTLWLWPPARAPWIADYPRTPYT